MDKDKLTELVEPLFHALIRLQREPVAIHMAEHVHADMRALFEACVRRAAELGISSGDSEDARFALAVAFDELVLAREGPLRDFWLSHPLQMSYFSTNLGGSQFFERLAVIQRDPARREVLKIYYACLALGFRGQYRLRGGEVELLDLTAAIRTELIQTKEIAGEVVLSPHAARPSEPLADGRRNQLLMAIAMSGAAAAALVYLGLRVLLMHRADAAVEQLTRLTAG